MAKKPKKEKMKTIEKPSAFESMLGKSEKNALLGIGPKTKQKQDDIFEIIDEPKLEVVDKHGKVVDPTGSSGELEWNQIKYKKPRSYSMELPVEEWKPAYFFVHFKELYRAKYPGVEFTTTNQVGAITIKTLKEDFKNLNGSEVSNSFIKNYIEWFVANELEKIIAKAGFFRPIHIRNKASVKRFLREYQEPQSVAAIVIPNVEVDFGSIDRTFNVDKISFLTNYGVVIAMAWLVNKKSLPVIKAKKIVADILLDARKEGESTLQKIVRSTKSLQPYPLSYNVEGLSEILAGIQETNIQFTNTAKEFV
jgi:hypothetical protein